MGIAIAGPTKGGTLKAIRYIPLLTILAIGCADETSTVDQVDSNEQSGKKDTPITPVIDDNSNDAKDDLLELRPENFVDSVNNPYFSITPGRKYFYDGKDAKGIKIHRELLASDKSKEINGINTITMWEREWHDDLLVSDTKKYYAQDKNNNVWIFGEYEQEIFGGYLKGEGDSWLSGENNAKAGIVVPGQPSIGQELMREYDGIEEEKSEILAVGESANTTTSGFSNCLKIRDYTTGTEEEEVNYYCKEAGNLTIETVPDTFSKIQLTRVEDNFSSDGINIKYPPYKTEITEEMAKKTALKKVALSDEVTAISIEIRDGTPVYVVDVLDDNKDTTKVYINLMSGSVIKTELI